MPSSSAPVPAAPPLSGGERALSFDPTFTDRVIRATGPAALPRLAEVMPSLVRHLHDFAREVRLTVGEWTAAVDMVNEAGRMSDDRRNETALLCDVVGLESLVDEITGKLLASSERDTPSAILGPFYRPDAPWCPNGASILRGADPQTTPWYDVAMENTARVAGTVTSAADGKPLREAVVDVWLTAPNGLYEQQDDAQPDMNLRGRFKTDDQGRYCFYALRPTPYPIPKDGPAGRLLDLLDRHPMRPGHIHFIVSAGGHRALVTQIFDDRDTWIGNDSVFADKDSLVVHFEPREGDPGAKWALEYDFVLGVAATVEEEGLDVVG